MRELNEEELLDWLEEKIEYLDSRKRKPGHGICCTCQRCGHVYDDCLCGDEEFYKQIKRWCQASVLKKEYLNRLVKKWKKESRGK